MQKRTISNRQCNCIKYLFREMRLNKTKDALRIAGKCRLQFEDDEELFSWEGVCMRRLLDALFSSLTDMTEQGL